MDQRLSQARQSCAEGHVSEAIDLVASIVDEADDEDVLVAAAEVVPRPVDIITRARLRLVIARAASRVQAPALRKQLEERLAETVDHFRPAADLSPAVMDQLAINGDRASLLDAVAAFTAEAATPFDRSRLHLLLASQALMDGRFDAVLRHVDDAVAFGGDGSDAFYLDPVFRSSMARLTGDGLEKLTPMVRDIIETLPFSARGWLALMLQASGERAECARLWDALAPHADSIPAEAPEFLIATVGFAELCAWLGDRETAPRLYERLLPYAGQHAIAHAIGPYEGPVDLALGRLAHASGDQTTAREHLHRAVAACRANHFPAYEALTLVELALTEARGTRARSESIDAARTIAESLGLEPVLAQLADMTAAASSGVLTPRESEIADLVSTGMTNAQIAEQLFLSERTVENHVSHAMIKLGVTSRTGLALAIRA